MTLKGPIILIEDDEDDQYLIGKALETLQVVNKVHFFPNGKVALDYLETTAEQPFLILCDINMPLMNGLELRRRINQSDYLRKKSTPFVFLTTAASAETIITAYEESVQGFYRKPSHFAHLQEQLKVIIAYWENCLHPNSKS